MGTGHLENNTIVEVLRLVEGVEGDFAEVGVNQGDLFIHLIPYAAQRGKKVHAFDSFVRMDTPGPLDDGIYPKGQFDQGGVEGFRAMLTEWGFDAKDYRLWDGYVPKCFQKCPDIPKLSFIYIDLDHYGPTHASIGWALEHLVPNAILGFDDYFKDQERLCSPAIDSLLAQRGAEFNEVFNDNNQLFLQRKING